MNIDTDERVVTAYCPLCRTLIPLVTVTFITEGRWRKRVTMILDGDGTDYVAHMWAHQQGLTDPG
jgi:hypothetical protein